MLRKWGTLVLLLLAMPALAFAQNSGKLAGRIIDSDTGDGLPGATVIIEGTSFGTATDVDGHYFIIGVPVGTYDVLASFVGFSTRKVEDVQISTGYTREIDFVLQPGLELDEIVVTYEKPLIQKDAIGVPKIVNAEEIVNLPVRGAAAVASIQAGVVSKEGSDALNIRGGRSGEVTYYIDGVKVVGSARLGASGSQIGLPQSAIEEQEMIIGSINARYGDAMSGIINITTKSGSSKFFGSLEGLTSESLDDFGYTLASGTLGGPIIPGKLSFFVSAEFLNEDDSNPRSVGLFALTDAQLDDLRGAPIGFLVNDDAGNQVILPIPNSLTAGASLNVDADGNPDVSSGGLVFSDGTTIAVPGNVDISTLKLNPASRAEHLTRSDFEDNLFKRAYANENLSLSGNLTWNVFKSGRLRLGGRYNTGEFETLTFGSRFTGTATDLRSLFSPDMLRIGERDRYQIYGTWTQYLSNNTFYQLQVDFSDDDGQTYDPRFGTGFDDFLEYGNIDNPAHAALKGYKNLRNLAAADCRTNEAGDLLVFCDRYEDGIPISSETTAGLVSLVGGTGNGYSKFHNQQFRLQASATTQLGSHQIEFGGEYEQRTQRFWGINARTLARFVADGRPEQIDPNDPDQNSDGYSSYSAIPVFVIEDLVGYYGYDVRGQNEVDTENFTAFLDTDKNKPEADYNIAPYEPIYYGGYIQDKLEFGDMVLNLGLRVDVFDNNQRVFKDKFARRPIVRAGEVGSSPAGIGSDYAVYFSGDNIIGYRDLQGNFYNNEGQSVNSGDIILNSLVRQTGSKITEEMFEDYEPQVTWMPRIGVSFPVTDQALFFASYGVVSQRPSGRNFADLAELEAAGNRDNNNLLPETTTKYELGFRQRVGSRTALTLSGFFHQINNLIQLRNLREATPNGFSRYENVDFGTVKGFEFGLDMRRTRGVALNANYTLSFADGTGSGDRTTSVIVWIDETPPNFISPLDFDQRHKMNLSIDYRLGAGEGPTVLGAKLFENFGINVLATAGSGFPYTGVIEPFPVNASRAPNPSGGVNEDRMPWTSRIDLRIDRRFQLSGGSSLTAFFWVQNVFDQTNTQNVWRFTGLPNDDGFLSTAGGIQFLESAVPASQTLYTQRNRILGYVGIPRLTRLGVRIDY